jgi:hypothetical protein
MDKNKWASNGCFIKELLCRETPAEETTLVLEADSFTIIISFNKTILFCEKSSS